MKLNLLTIFPVLLTVISIVNVDGVKQKKRTTEKFKSQVEFSCPILNPPTLTGECKNSILVNPKNRESFKLDVTVFRLHDSTSMINESFSIQVGRCSTGPFFIQRQVQEVRSDKVDYNYSIFHEDFKPERIIQQTFTIEFTTTNFTRFLSNTNDSNTLHCSEPITYEKDGTVRVFLDYKGNMRKNIRVMMMDTDPPLTVEKEEHGLFTDGTFHPEFFFYVFFGIFLAVVIMGVLIYVMEIYKNKHRKPKMVRLILLTREIVALKNKIKPDNPKDKNSAYQRKLEDKELEANTIRYELGLIKTKPERPPQLLASKRSSILSVTAHQSKPKTSKAKSTTAKTIVETEESVSESIHTAPVPSQTSVAHENNIKGPNGYANYYADE